MKVIKTEDFSSTMNLPKKTITVDGNLVKRQGYFLEKIRDNTKYKKAIKKNEVNAQKYKIANFPVDITDNVNPTVVFNQILKDIYIRYEMFNGNIVDDVITFLDEGYQLKSNDENTTDSKKDEKQNKKQINENLRLKQVAQNRINTNLKKQIAEINTLGTMLDYNEHYNSTNEANIEAIIIDKFLELYKKNKIQRSFRPIHYCTKCKVVTDKSNIKYKKEEVDNYYILYNLKNDKDNILKGIDNIKNVYFIANTIMPWSMISSEWIAVAKDVEYSVVQVLEKNEKKYFIIASDMVDEFMSYNFYIKYVVVKTLDYTELTKLECFNPLNYNKIVKVIATNENNIFVDKKNSSGIRIVSSGHSYLDYLIHKEVNKYKLKSVLNSDGTTNSLALVYNNMNYEEVNVKIVEFLKNNSFIFYSNKVKTAIAYCRECNEKLVYRSKSEWYLIKDKKITTEQYDMLVSKMSSPDKYKNEELKNQIEKINNSNEVVISDRNEISTPIPVFYCAECGHEIVGEKINKIVTKIFKEKGSDFWYKSTPEEILQGQVGCQKCGGAFLFKDDGSLNELFKDLSIPFVMNKDNTNNNLCIECKEKFYNKLKELSFTDEIDYIISSMSKIMIHSIVDESMKNISTSSDKLNNNKEAKNNKKNTKVKKHNITIAEENDIKSEVAIKKVINNYGTDILRLWVISKSNYNTIKLNDQYMINTNKTYMKIRRTFKYLLSNLADFNPTKNYIKPNDRVDIDKIVYNKLITLSEDIKLNYDKLNLKKVYDLLIKFCTNDLCNEYFETIKYRLYVLKQNDNTRRSTQSTLYDVLMNFVVFFGPILPFTLEEIWPYIWHSNDEEKNNILLFRNNIEHIIINVDEEKKKWDRIYKLKNNIRPYLLNARKENIIKHKIEATLIINVNNEDAKKFIEDNYDDVRATLGVSKIEVNVSDEQGFEVVKSEGAQCRRCRQYSIYIGQNFKYTYLCPKCADILES